MTTLNITTEGIMFRSLEEQIKAEVVSPEAIAKIEELVSVKVERSVGKSVLTILNSSAPKIVDGAKIASGMISFEGGYSELLRDFNSSVGNIEIDLLTGEISVGEYANFSDAWVSYILPKLQEILSIGESDSEDIEVEKVSYHPTFAKTVSVTTYKNGDSKACTHFRDNSSFGYRETFEARQEQKELAKSEAGMTFPTFIVEIDFGEDDGSESTLTTSRAYCNNKLENKMSVLQVQISDMFRKIERSTEYSEVGHIITVKITDESTGITKVFVYELETDTSPTVRIQDYMDDLEMSHSVVVTEFLMPYYPL